jgi:hypothetical protein
MTIQVYKHLLFRQILESNAQGHCFGRLRRGDKILHQENRLINARL